MQYLATSPIFYFVVFISLGCLVFYTQKHRKILFIFITPLCIFSYLLLTGFGANAAVKFYAGDLKGVNCTNQTGVLLPSGLWRLPDDEKDYASISESSFRRIHAAIKWLRENDARTLLVSGDGARSNHSEAKIIYNYIGEFNISKERLSFENKSTSTHLSAINTAKLTAPTHITLITSELHMRRALATFQKIGFTACPLISDYQFQETDGLLRFLPNAEATQKSERVLHELVGYFWYRWTDRI